ncbi:MAG: four helix bundle protein [Candidatus Moranbacteria bacterium]|nr:four helix bundle protein [Candidatus Moranbacteria bacterium]MBP6034051.1 four helix bundle protein [Candidatus Moranbacteria bacterium]MBP7696118.1 four helix bundle protein [Candidatus Moranbacteria bacterium]
MIQIQKTKIYDLEERTLEYGKRIIHLSRSLPKDVANDTISGQLMRSGTSLGANYREANETVTKKDFSFRMRICRKEAKETVYWLQLVVEANPDLDKRVSPLLQETRELVKIFAAIIEKSK